EQAGELILMHEQVVVVVLEGVDGEGLHASADAAFQAGALVPGEVEAALVLQVDEESLEGWVERLSHRASHGAEDGPFTSWPIRWVTTTRPAGPRRCARSAGAAARRRGPPRPRRTRSGPRPSRGRRLAPGWPAAG